MSDRDCYPDPGCRWYVRRSERDLPRAETRLARDAVVGRTDALIFRPRCNHPDRVNDVGGAFQPHACYFAHYNGIPAESIRVINNGQDNGRSRAGRKSDVLAELQSWSGPELGVIAFLCHGWERGFQFGFRIGDVEALARAIAAKAARDVKIALYACLTGGSPQGKSGGEGGFAFALRDKLVEEGCTQCRVDAHTTRGHSTKNPHVLRFEGPSGSPGQWIVEPGSELWPKWRKTLKHPFDRQSPLLWRFPLMSISEIHEYLGDAQSEQETGAPAGDREPHREGTEAQRITPSAFHITLPFTEPDAGPFDEENVQAYYEESENGLGGWYPIGTSQTWHNGIHLTRARHHVIRAVASGRIVAVRFARNDELEDFAFGSPGFVLAEHRVNLPPHPKGPVVARVQESLSYKETLGDEEVAGTLSVGELVVLTGEQGMNFVPSEEPSEDPEFAGSWLAATSSMHEGTVWISIDDADQLTGTSAYTTATVTTSEDEDEETGAKGLNCRATPGGTVLGVIPEKAEVQLYAITQGNWQAVRAPDQGISGGWIYTAGDRVKASDADDTVHTFYSLYMNVAFEGEDQSQVPIPWIRPYLPHLVDEKPHDDAELAYLVEAVELDSYDTTLPKGTVVWWGGSFDDEQDLISPPTRGGEAVIFAPVPRRALKRVAPSYEYGRIVTSEDDGGLNCRSYPDTSYADSSIVGVIPKGAYVKMYEEKVEAGGWTWRIVRAPEHGIEYGWITTTHEGEDVADNAHVPADIQETANKLKEGNCVKLDLPIEGGDPIANTGLIHPAGLVNGNSDAYGVHLEIFSKENVFNEAHMEGGDWTLVEDTSDKYIICESDETFASVAKSLEDGAVRSTIERLGWGGSEASAAEDVKEVRQALAENLPLLRTLITRNTSYWAIDWQKVKSNNPDWAKAFTFTDEDARMARRYAWWGQRTDLGLPASALVYHYHPVAFLDYLNDHRTREASMAPVFYVKREERVDVTELSEVKEDERVYVRESGTEPWLLGKRTDRGLAYGDWGHRLYDVLIKKEVTEGIPELDASEKRIWASLWNSEGGLFAINTWDTHFLSFGPFQQTIGGPGGRGELSGALYYVKTQDSALFNQYFGRYGLDIVDVSSKPEEQPDDAPELVYAHLELDGVVQKTKKQKQKFRGFLWAYRCKKAMEDPRFRKLFLEHGFKRIQIVRKKGGELGDHEVKLEDIYKTELGLALLTDFHIWRPAWAPGLGMDAAKAVLSDEKKNDLDALTLDDEKKMIKKLIEKRHAKSSRMKRRTGFILLCVKDLDDALAKELGYDSVKAIGQDASPALYKNYMYDFLRITR